MGSFRQNGARTDIKTPLLVVLGLLVLVGLLAMVQRQLRRQHRKQYHAALNLESSGVVGQIHRRKEDLNRFINKLKSQLAVREQQLRAHDELEEIMTARVETSRSQEKEWSEIMSAGKKLHGKKWNAPTANDGPSMRELMEMHKDELLQIKSNMEAERRTPRRAQVSQMPSARLPITTGLDQGSRAAQVVEKKSVDPQLISARHVPPQWQSTRRMAGTVGSPPSVPVEINPNPAPRFSYTPSAPAVSIPKLDFSRLGITIGTDTPNEFSPSKTFEPTKKKSFQQMFERQATLANSLKKKH